MRDLPELPQMPTHAGRIEWAGLPLGKPAYTADQLRSYAREAMQLGRRAGLEEAARICEAGVSVPYDSPPATHMHIAVPELAAAIRAVSNTDDSGKPS